MEYIEYIFEFYYKIFISFTPKEFVKDLLLPLINIVAIIYIFKKGEDNRKEDQKVTNKFQNEINDKNLKLQEDLNEFNIMHNIEAKRPIFSFVRQEVSISVPFDLVVPLDISWSYNPVDPSNLNINQLKNEPTKLWFKNIGENNARDLIIRVHHINAVEYFSSYPLFITFNGSEKQFNIVSEENEFYLKCNEEEYYKIYNAEDTYYRKYRIVPYNGTQMTFLNKSDLIIFNNYILNIAGDRKLPALKVELEYSDEYGNNYEDEIFLAVDSWYIKNSGDNVIINFTFDEMHRDRALSDEQTMQEVKSNI